MNREGRSATATPSAKTKYTCISADCHIDLVWLPPDLFTRNASKEMKERMPFVTESPDGPRWITKNGINFGLAGGMGSSGRKYVPGKIDRADRMAAEGIFSEASRISRRLSDPHQRIKDQDRDGVQAEVLYGILKAAHLLRDPEAAWEVCRIYNDWLVDFCGNYPDRLIGLPVILGYEIAQAVKEVDRMIKLGAKGIELSVTTDMIPLHDPLWDPLWKILGESGVPIHFHSAPIGVVRRAPSSHWGPGDVAVSNAIFTTMAQIGSSSNLTAMILSGMLERYPNLKVVLGESGIGWIPYFLDRMDYEWEDQFRRDLALKMKPSDYWKRQCKATFQYDEVGVSLINFLGEDTLMWASDFPHPDGVWPDSQEYIRKQFSQLPKHVLHKIVSGTAASLYRLN